MINLILFNYTKMFFEITILLITIYVGYYYVSNRRPTGTGHLKTVPMVRGSLPYFGHGLTFSKDIPGFVRKAYREYGPIFRLKIFNKDIVVVADESMKKDFFNATESKMSLYEILKNLFFGEAFCDNGQELENIIKIVKGTVTIKFEEFVPKIMEQAKRMTDQLKKQKETDKFYLNDAMIKFVAYTSALCFVGVEIDEIYPILVEFTHELNYIVVFTYFLPLRVVSWMFYKKLQRIRHRMCAFFTPIIEEYRADSSKRDSLLIRNAVDYKDVVTGRQLSSEEIGNIIVCLLYVSSENTALGLSSTVTDLATNQTWWNKIRNIAGDYMQCGDVKGLLSDTDLEAVCMESARMNTHIFALQRKPLNKSAQIGGYYIGDAGSVALCEPMFHLYEASTEFKDAMTYDPDRFLNPRNEKMDSKNIMTWGSGVHLCPGKLFALYEIKLAVTMMVTNFDIVLPEVIPPLNYFSPSAYAERKLLISLKKNEYSQSSVVEKKFETVQVGTKSAHVYTTGEHKGWLLREYFTKEEQEKIFTDLYNEAKISESVITDAPKDKAFPFAYYNLVYTGQSNIKKPTEMLSKGLEIWNLLSSEINKVYPSVNITSFNSLYSQLFGLQGKMASHKDEYVDWGVSISIGASSDFTFGEHTIKLHSGDVFVADFSQVMHSVDKINDNPPGWFNEENPNFKLYDRTRCSIQIRNIGKFPEPISEETFKGLVFN
jgi:cytochrome P450